MKPTVYVVDDDAGVREALDAMLTSAGMGVVTTALDALSFIADPFGKLISAGITGNLGPYECQPP